MTDKELRKLGRIELIDIIYQLEKRQNELQEENMALKSKLDSVRITIDEAGSIAEAAVRINGVFEAAQKAADQYLSEIHRANSETEEHCKYMISKEEREVLPAKRNAQAITEEAEDQTDKKWSDLTAKTEQVLKAHAELQSLVSNLYKRG